MEFTLPDCISLDLRLDLTPGEEELLLQEIARDGRKGLDRFSGSYEKDHSSDGFGERLRRYRERLEKQAARVLDDRARGLEHEEEDRMLLRRLQRRLFHTVRPDSDT